MLCQQTLSELVACVFYFISPKMANLGLLDQHFEIQAEILKKSNTLNVFPLRNLAKLAKNYYQPLEHKLTPLLPQILLCFDTFLVEKNEDGIF